MLKKLAKTLNIETEQPVNQCEHKRINKNDQEQPLNMIIRHCRGLYNFLLCCVKNPTNTLKKFRVFRAKHSEKIHVFWGSALNFLWPSVWNFDAQKGSNGQCSCFIKCTLCTRYLVHCSVPVQLYYLVPGLYCCLNAQLKTVWPVQN